MALSVTAQAGFSRLDNHLYIAVLVLDAQGNPVSGLTKTSFKILQVAGNYLAFEQLGDPTHPYMAMPNPQAPDLYQLSIPFNWTLSAGISTLAFYVTVDHTLGLKVTEHGGAFCWIVVSNP